MLRWYEKKEEVVENTRDPLVVRNVRKYECHKHNLIFPDKAREDIHYELFHGSDKIGVPYNPKHSKKSQEK